MRTSQLKNGRQYSVLAGAGMSFSGCYAQVEVLRADHPAPRSSLTCVHARMLKLPANDSARLMIQAHMQRDGTYLFPPRMIECAWEKQVERDRNAQAQQEQQMMERAERGKCEAVLRQQIRKSGTEGLSFAMGGMLVEPRLAGHLLVLLEQHGLPEEEETASSLLELLSGSG